MLVLDCVNRVVIIALNLLSKYQTRALFAYTYVIHVQAESKWR